MDDAHVAQHIVRSILKLRRTPQKRRQLLDEIVSLYEKVVKTEPKRDMGMMYLALRRMGDTHEEACKAVAQAFGKSKSTVEHCIGPTRRALLHWAENADDKTKPVAARLVAALLVKKPR